MTVNINYADMLGGLRDAARALTEFNSMVKAEADALREQNASLTEAEAINIILKDRALQQGSSIVNHGKTSYGNHGDIRGTR